MAIIALEEAGQEEAAIFHLLAYAIEDGFNVTIICDCHGGPGTTTKAAEEDQRGQTGQRLVSSYCLRSRMNK